MSATAPPCGKNDPITLTARARGCTPDSAGPDVTSPTYSPAPPGANFTFSAGQINQPINFTDTSSPQATSWLWLFDDGGTSTSQSPSHTYTQGGTHNVTLIASNGSGSTLKILPLLVTGAASSRASTSARIGFEVSEPEWRRMNDVPISGPRQAWLTITSRDSHETYTLELVPAGCESTSSRTERVVLQGTNLANGTYRVVLTGKTCGAGTQAAIAAVVSVQSDTGPKCANTFVNVPVGGSVDGCQFTLP